MRALTQNSLNPDKRCHHRRLGRHRRAPLLKGWVLFSVLLCVRVVVYVVVAKQRTPRPPIFVEERRHHRRRRLTVSQSRWVSNDAVESTVWTPTLEVTTTTTITVVVVGKRSSRFRGPSRPKRRRRTKTTKTKTMMVGT